MSSLLLCAILISESYQFFSNMAYHCKVIINDMILVCIRFMEMLTSFFVKRKNALFT